MKNKLTDLNDHLFAQIERLSDEELNGDKLNHEINRTKAMTAIAKDIISAGRLSLDAQKALGDRQIATIPPMLEHSK